MTKHDRLDSDTAEFAQAEGLIDTLQAAILAGDVAAIQALFDRDVAYRDIFGLEWRLHTIADPAALARHLRDQEITAVAIDPDLFPRRRAQVGDRPVAVLPLAISTRSRDRIVGVARIALDGPARLLSLATTILDYPRQQSRPADEDTAHGHEPYAARRVRETAFEDRDPQVLIVGAGHAGLSAAAELRQLGVDALVIDRQEALGDNWRTRYESLHLHNKTPINHMPYLRFPSNAPTFLPKDKVANWLDFYADTLDLNVWSGARFDGATRDPGADTYTARVILKDGTRRTLRPGHIIMATSVSGTPKMPEVPGLEAFRGRVIHSSEHTASAEWAGRPVMVFGTGSSAHDIASDLHLNGAQVTMVQRSPTMIVSIDPAAQLYDQIYMEATDPIEVLDLLNVSMPFPLVKTHHQGITRRVKDIDRDLHDRLRKVGFRLSFGDDEAGWPLLFRTRGGGYYFNAGCSDLIADGSIGLVQHADIDGYTADGIVLTDGREVPADLMIFATGYTNFTTIVERYFGAEVADRVGEVWGLDPDTQELRNMWSDTGLPGLWFTGGAFSQCRIFSKYLAFQIARDLGL